MPDHFYADDSAVASPSRVGMRSLVAVGGIYVPAANIHRLLTNVDNLCAGRGFPDGEEFKWSPRRNSWMYSGLTGTSRSDFFSGVTTLCADSDVTAIVCIVDTSAASASGASVPEHDALQLLLERVNRQAPNEGVVVVMDQPGGNHKTEDTLAKYCRDLLRRGTTYSKLSSIVGPPLFAESHNQRLLQVADVVTSCVTGVIGGRSDDLALATFADIVPLLRKTDGLVGGHGLKIHPDGKYANLYGLVGDRYLYKRGVGQRLPITSMPYPEVAPVVRPQASLSAAAVGK